MPHTHHTLRFGLALLITLSASLGHAQPPSIEAPNVVTITPALVTAGQPSAESLAGLSAQGFEAVVYLAPPTVSDAVRDEAAIVGRQGLVFVNIPIKFDNPSAKDFETFAAVLGALSGRKILVHCQVNLRASSMVFLYRAITAKEDPAAAYQAVAQVWAPHGAWKQLIQTQLQQHGVHFQPF
ncbi:MAG: protein tyrosine phosphatase family protein [Rhodoferax sp.]|nr:protein tyrosine phosphatase family protein [Rhodoferax sp.]